MSRASQAGHVSAAHDLSDGGLAQVLVESCLRRNVGARIMLPEQDATVTPFVWLFSESAGRALVAVPRGHDKAFTALAAEHNISCVQIGVTMEEPVLDIHHEFTIELDELRAAYTATMRNLFGGPAEGVTGQVALAAEADQPVTPDDDEAAGDSAPPEIHEHAAEPHETASGPADEVAGLPTRAEQHPAAAPTQPAEPEEAEPEEDEPESTG